MTNTVVLKRALIPIVALAVAVAVASCSPGAATPPSGEPTVGASAPASASAAANSADVMFATMMIPHHRQAIEMSDMLLGKDGIDPKVSELAQKIKGAQAPEIELMNSWLGAWGAPTVAPGDGGMSGMNHGSMGSGMMSEDDMAALNKASGPEASRLFLEQMIQHHEGAIAMAQTELDQGQNPDALALAQKIIDTQTAEIAEMKALLAGN